MNIFKKLSIKTQMYIIATTTITVVFAIIFITFSRFTNITSEKNDDYTQQMIHQIKHTVSNNCNVLDRIILNIKYNKVIQDYILEEEPLQKFALFKNVKNFMSNMKDMKEGILDIVIIDNDNNVVELNEGSMFANQILHKLNDKKIYYSGMQTYLYGQEKIKCFVIASEIFLCVPSTSKKIGESIGKVMIVCRTNTISGEIGDNSKKDSTKLYVVDRNNNIFSTNQPDEFGLRLDTDKNTLTNNKSNKLQINKKDYYLNIEKLPEVEGKVVSIVPQNELFYDVRDLQIMGIITFIIAIIALSLPFTLIINNILNPIKKFMIWIKNVKSGNLKNLKVRVNVDGYSEISVMSNEFNNMMDEIDSLAHKLLETNSRLYEMELDKKHSELEYLRSQINPHFLYNTFESIKGIAIDKEVPQIVDMTKALGKVFRYSVKGANMVTLNEEVSIIKSYISIQLIRFSGRFEASYKISPNTLSCLIPKMILQPIVENSIYHGLEPKLEKGLLSIDSTIDASDDLTIIVKDNGVGIEKNIKSKIINSLKDCNFNNQYNDDKKSIGIVNVNNRIKLIYGSKYGINIKSDTNKGTQILIKIPSRRS